MTRGMFGRANDGSDKRPGGGNLPSLRPHYPQHIAQALHDLAERRPPWPDYLRERQRILEGHQ